MLKKIVLDYNEETGEIFFNGYLVVKYLGFKDNETPYLERHLNKMSYVDMFELVQSGFNPDEIICLSKDGLI